MTVSSEVITINDQTASASYQEVAEVGQKTKRVYAFDWLRILIILNLVPFHVVLVIHATLTNDGARVLYAAAPERIDLMILYLYVYIVAPIHMPVLFLLAGYSAGNSLKQRSLRQFLNSRVNRLVIPLLASLIVFNLIAVYFWPTIQIDRSITQFMTGFVPFYFGYYLTNYFGGIQFLNMWFVAYLIIFTAILLPLMINSGRGVAGKAMAWLSSKLDSRWGIFFPFLLYIGVFGLLAPIWPMFRAHNLLTDITYFVHNFIAFTIGYLIFLKPTVIERIKRMNWLWVGLFVATVAIRFALSLVSQAFVIEAYTLEYAVASILGGINAWAGILMVVSLALNFINRKHPWLSQLATASYPFFIIHMGFSIFFVYVVVWWPYTYLIKFGAATFFAFVASALTYWFIIRPWTLIHRLFGITIR